jgi:O-antigen/teichoic acid export membrane protein
MNNDKKITSNESIKGAVKHGVLWSVIQNWGGRLITFITSIILARLLGPEEYGIIGIAFLILTFIPMIADFGFGVAIIQKKNLSDEDLNLPFYISLFLGFCLLLILFLFSSFIEHSLKAPGLSVYLYAIAVITIITIPASFQEALYVRNALFRELAYRRLVIDFGAGIIAVILAFNGFGVWSLIIQAAISAAFGFIWLWTKPQWLPTFNISTKSFNGLLKVGMPVFLERIREFLSNKIIDFLIVTALGLAAYGIFVVANRLYTILMQLLHGAIFNVLLTSISKIADDLVRLRSIYIKTIGFSSTVTSPFFVLLAAISPEIMDVLFGKKWIGIDTVSVPLMLLGAVHTIQYVNGAFLTSIAKSGLTLFVGIVKTFSTVLILYFFGSNDLVQLTWLFVLSQLVVTPLSFYVVWSQIRFPIKDFLKLTLETTIGSALAYFTITYLRDVVSVFITTSFLKGLTLAFIFAIVHLVYILIVNPKRIDLIYEFVKDKKRK